MPDLFVAGAAGIGAILGYYFIEKGKKTLPSEKTQMTINYRRNWDEPMGIEVWRAAGQYLHNSGHPDELRLRRNFPQSLAQIRQGYTRKQEGNKYLINGHYINTALIRRQQFSGPSNEIHYPIQEMGSGWYAKSVKTKKPYISRIVPWNGYNL